MSRHTELSSDSGEANREESDELLIIHRALIAQNHVKMMPKCLEATRFIRRKMTCHRNRAKIVAISMKLPLTRPHKSYHPNIRLLLLLDTMKLCIIQLMCLLTIVPINLNCFDHHHRNQFHPQATFIPQNTNFSHFLNNHQLNIPPSPLMNPLSHANQIAPLSTSNQRWTPQQQPLIPISMQKMAPAIPLHHQVVVQRRNEMLQPTVQQLVNPYQAYQLQPVRPAKLMAEYVANQGQRILKNLVNTTIADLVAQSTMKINANKNSPSGSTAMGKLYTLLFPTPSPLVTFSPIQIVTPASGFNQTNQDTLGETVFQSNSSTSDLYLNEQQGREEKDQIFSLSAPYESQSRPTTGGRMRSSRLHAGSPTIGQQVGAESNLETSGDEWRRPITSDTSNADVAGGGGGLSQESNPLMFDHQQLESVGDEMLENGSLKAELDTDSLNSYEADLLKSHKRDTKLRGRKPMIIREAEFYSPSKHHATGDEHAIQNQQAIADEQAGGTSNFTPEVDFSSPPFGKGPGGRGKLPDFENSSQYNQQLNVNNYTQLVSDLNDSTSPLNIHTTQESVEDVGPNTSDSSLEASELVQMPPRSQRQPKHFRHKLHEQSNDQQQQQQQQQQLQEQPVEEEPQHRYHTSQRHHNHHHHQETQEPDVTNHQQQIVVETRNEMPHGERDAPLSVHGSYASDEPSSTSEQPALRGIFSNESSSASRSDDSFFSAHLPSQYEAVMRLPPEGYYDDYFKPSTVSGGGGGQALLHPPPASSFMNQESVPSSMSEFSGLSTQSASTSRNHPTEGAVQYETILEELPTSNYSSDAIRNKLTVPSYKSQIITADENQFKGNNNNTFSYSQPTVGYTKQYFTNQALRQEADGSNDARIEFIATNRTMASEDKGGLEGLNYEIPGVYDPKINQLQNVTLEPIPSGEEYNNTLNRYQSSMSTRNLTLSSGSQQMNSPSEDSIKLIIANTISNARDPQSNEKLINYTSDGYNMTRGKSPRNNFINKDMNEFPPADLPAQTPSMEQEAGLVATPMNTITNNGQRGFMLQQPVQPNQLQQSLMGNSQHVRQRQLPQQQQILPQFPRSPMRSPSLPEPEQLTTEQPEVKEQASSQPEEIDPDKRITADDAIQKQRVIEPSDVRHLLPVLGARNSSPLQPSKVTLLPAPNSHEEHHNEHHHHHVEQQQPQDQLNLMNGETDRQDEGTDPEQPLQNRNQDQRMRQDDKRRDRKYKGRYSKQHTIARPQITQVAFNPKDLTMRPPKPMTAASESPLEALAEIPQKVEQLRENQPDKNELMNELLTALDRVKVAIYKLQPLTAKMNAIYRKSVTSNTRDIVMDNNKGTYAKRYPPGDYDDSYDPMHPSERFIRHSQRASQRNDVQDKSETQPQQPGTRPAAEMEPNESVENAVYLPAPKEVLEMHKREIPESGQQVGVTNVELDSLSALESKIVATGIGRRLGDGRVSGQLILDSGERLIYDDEDPEETNNSNATTIDRSMSSFFPPLNQTVPSDEVDMQDPLFGYRITIYRSPEAETAEESRPQEQFAYQVEEDEEPSVEADEDFMATSESSLVSSTQQPSFDSEEPSSIALIVDSKASTSGDLLDGSESKSKKHSGNKDDKKKKSQSKKKKNEEESKKKKEYKKIKHNKGIVSKEKKTMHRDKHIKAHDRGAAKEKALKERTQIEFFEREQIVDDEYEKGKKSTVKGGWQTGQDSKKSIKESLGDTMSSGGSHYVKHEPHESSEKGHKVSSEASSAKKSNKFEKKQMEAKGKKFKGWREKGYKIITETEFIDRGSLHDSAYKKRDKGAAHHQKFKKQEASSEGHHGSMMEHHKKSNKKEEKSEKKGDDLKKKKKPKAKKKSSKKTEEDDDHDHDESIIAATADQNEDRGDSQGQHETSGTSRKEHRSRGQQQPMLMSATSSTFRPTILIQNPESSQTRTLIRLLNSNVHDDHQPAKSGGQADRLYKSSNGHENLLHQLNVTSSGRANYSTSNLHEPTHSKYHLLNDTTLYDTNRRSDITAPAKSIKNPRSLFSNSSLLAGGNSTILNIVDNLTGRQINKTKIGTYDLEDHHTISLNNNNNNNSSLIKLGNGLAKYFPFLSPTAQVFRSSNNAVQTNVPPSSATTTSTTTRPPIQSVNMLPSKKPDKVDNLNPPMNHNMLSLQNHNQFLNFNLPQANHNPHQGNNILNLAHNNHQQHQKSDSSNNQIMINGLRTMDNSQQIKINNPTTRTPGFITPEQANAAAQILQLVQRASQVNQAGPNHLANHQPPNLIDLQQQQQLNPLQGSIHRAAFIPPTMTTNSYQPAPIFPPQINFATPSGTGFGAEQFLDYEHDPVLQHHATHNFLTD